MGVIGYGLWVMSCVGYELGVWETEDGRWETEDLGLWTEDGRLNAEY